MEHHADEMEQGGPDAPEKEGAESMGVKALSVLLVVVVVMFAFYVLVAEGVIDFSPPYPSEDTPLVLQSWGVTWVREYEMVIDDLPAGLNYSDMSISLTEYQEGSTSGWSSTLLTGGPLDPDGFTPPDTIEEADEMMNWVHHSSYWLDGEEVHVITSYFIFDETDSLRFNIGDSISLVRLVFTDDGTPAGGFPEDIVYEVELYYDGHGSIYSGYGFAVHGGELYSWIDRGPVDDPLS